jgi:predicted ATPase/transcriptional regulator with XRE-family HTH domain
MQMAGESTLAGLLRGHRTAAGLTQEELAERAGISTRAVSDIERGLRRVIYRDTAGRLAEALKLADEAREAFQAAARGRGQAGIPSARESFIEDEVDLTAPPIPPTRLIGREREVGGLKRALLDPFTRVVTLVGPGGVGKTRLAIEASRAFSGDFADGVCFVSLGDIGDPELVMPAIAGALKVRAAGEPLVGAIASRLRDKKVLLVLDTFEHLPEAAPAVAEMLSVTPSIKVLTTSRSPLNIRGEHQVVVDPLDVPAATLAEQRSDEPELAPAVELFLERARAVMSDFDLDGTQRPLVDEISRRLEGVPLAIELAAARIRHLTATEILSHLEDRLPILTGGPVDLPARHQTMADTVSWSYDLLGSVERRLLQDLSVFSGGWSLESARHVCQDDAIAADLLGTISRLLDSSLVLRRDTGESAPRYSMLDVVRSYAADRLVERVGAAGMSKLRRRHADHFLAFAEEAEPQLRSSGHRAWIARVATERNNLRTAFNWATANTDAELALRLTGALWMFWRPMGAFSEGRAWLEQALRLDPAGCETARAKALWGAAWLAYQQGAFAETTLRGDELLRWARQAGEPPDIRNGLTLLGMAHMAKGEYRVAGVLFEEALQIGRRLGPGWLLATSLLNRSVAAMHCDDLALAQKLMNEAHALYQQLGDDRFTARVLVQLGFVALSQGDGLRAGDLMMTGLAIFTDLGDRWGVAEQLGALSAVSAAAGDWQRAARIAGAADATWESIGARPHPADSASIARWLRPARDRVGETQWQPAFAEGCAMRLEAAAAYALEQ